MFWFCIKEAIFEAREFQKSNQVGFRQGCDTGVELINVSYILLLTFLSDSPTRKDDSGIKFFKYTSLPGREILQPSSADKDEGQQLSDDTLLKLLIHKIKNGKESIQYYINSYREATKSFLVFLWQKVTDTSAEAIVVSVVVLSVLVALVMKWAYDYRNKVKYEALQNEIIELRQHQADLALEIRDEALEMADDLREVLKNKENEAEAHSKAIEALKTEITHLSNELDCYDSDLALTGNEIKNFEVDNALLREKLWKSEAAFDQLELLSSITTKKVEKQEKNIGKLSETVYSLKEETSKFKDYVDEIRKLESDVRNVRKEKVKTVFCKTDDKKNKLSTRKKRAALTFAERFYITATFEVLKAAFC